ncbi:MAG: metallophosphoesterase family protein [Bacteroidales bacterium]|nr:metallophosphoesterase family protein [Bacteroidales bacterium]
MKVYKLLLFLGFSFILTNIYAQSKVPDIYSDIFIDESGNYYHKLLGKKFYAKKYDSFMSLENMQGNPKGTKNGIEFYFGSNDFEGKLYYGLIDYTDSKHPMPVWFKKTASIKNGKTEINIQDNLSGKYDMSEWEKKGNGTLGYRVANNKGELLYDGFIAFEKTKAGFKIIPTVIEGPFVNLINETGVVISFETNFKIKTNIVVNGKSFSDKAECKHHEIKITGLKPSTEYKYKVKYGNLSQEYRFKTAHKKGERKPFVFAYTSDSRAGQGGGERNLFGTNFYIMRKIAALANFKDVAFMQFTGDMVNGYSHDKRDINLQYANWKRAIEPFAHYYPIIAGIGNHEVTGKIFVNEKGSWRAAIDGFPFETESSSAIFATNFVNPKNGPKSEDGAYYDPNPNKTDFPPYDETVFYYIYDNIAVIVLNSDYWYAPSLKRNNRTSGNLHAYIMDMQLEWLEKTISELEKDEDIDHVFVTQHTPAFPNGGHVKDDMWYNGNNKYRPYVAGEPVKKGIIERRDEYLDILINKSTKVVALMTGDEHNYNKVKISPDVNIYPEKYEFEKIKRKRTIWQINNGSAGAPYYAQDKNTPWANSVSGFTTQQVLVLIYIEGKKVSVKVVNAETFESVDEYILRD